MKVFIQGMRRNGTTVLFDLFRTDPGFNCFYEPLAAAKAPCFGGGSAINKNVDYFENVRDYRERVLRSGDFGDDPQIFNYGAPRDPVLEFTSSCPNAITTYLACMLESSDHVAIKFTRAAYKVAYLHHLEPSAQLLHIVRDPRRVVASYIFGKNAKHRAGYEQRGDFFQRALNRIGWNGAAFSDVVLQQPEYSRLQDLPDYQRILLLWKDCFEKTYESGRQWFGDRYRLIRHEELSCHPRVSLEGIYRSLGLAVPHTVLQWATEHLRPPSPIYEETSIHWRAGYERVGLNRILDETGYPPP